MNPRTRTGLLKLMGVILSWLLVFGLVLVVTSYLGDSKSEDENAAYNAVLVYASNRVIQLPQGDKDRMKVIPVVDDSCPSHRWVHPCWMVEYPTKYNTYRWIVDLRNPQKKRRRGLDSHGKIVWMELYEYYVKRLPPFDSVYAQSEEIDK